MGRNKLNTNEKRHLKTFRRHRPRNHLQNPEENSQRVELSAEKKRTEEAKKKSNWVKNIPPLIM